MYNIISIIVFTISLLIYIHVSYYYREADDYDIIILDENENFKTLESFNKTLEDLGRSKLPCIFTNTTIINTLKNHMGFEINYIHLLMSLNELKLYIPFSYKRSDGSEGDVRNKRQENCKDTDIYITIEAVEFMENDICINKEPLCFDINKFNNKNSMTEKQCNIIATMRDITEVYTMHYLFNQYITKRDYFIYFSNYESTSYLKMQYFKNPLNVFCVLDGDCDVVIAHPSYCNKKNVHVKEDYIFFRFYDEQFQFDNNTGDITGDEINIFTHYKCYKGDVIVLPAYWFICIRLNSQCVLGHESALTATSTLSLAPDYVKYLFYRSTVKTVSNTVV